MSRAVLRTCAVVLFCVVLLCGVAPTISQAEDLVEFLSGAKARGAIREIRKAKMEFDFEVRIGSRRLVRTYAFGKVHAVTIDGKRYVLTAKGASGSKASGGDSGPRRTQSQVLELINASGRTPPDWFESTPLDYPSTLQLDWPLKPTDKGWKNQKNVGQYKWDIINPNPSKWKSGVRLVHEVMSRHKGKPDLLRRDMKVLGEMHFELFQDYARAAFWLRRANVRLPEPQGIHLAECYWRLGNKNMALDILSAGRLPMNSIKLLGDMGQTDRAAKLAEAFARSNPQRAHEPLLLGGDACRRAGRYEQALKFYNKVLQLGAARNKEYQNIYDGRASDSIAAVELFDRADVSRVADGAYRASSTGYTGRLEVEVKVAGGKIKSVRVTSHGEKQFYAALTDTPARILKKQSVKHIDATSRATITSQAIVNATAKALARGAK